MLKTLFGGTFGYIQAGVIGIAAIGLIWLWRDYTGLKADNERLEADLSAAHTQIEQQGNSIAALSNRDTRRSEATIQRDNIAKDIYNAEDGQNCANSQPIRAVLDGLSNRAGAQAKPNNPE